MNDIDYLEEKISDLKYLVISLARRQGLELSNYEENTFCTPEEEEENEKKFSENQERIRKLWKGLNKK